MEAWAGAWVLSEERGMRTGHGMPFDLKGFPWPRGGLCIGDLHWIPFLALHISFCLRRLICFA